MLEKNEYYDDDDALQECGDLLSGCYGEEETTAQKDHQVFLSENCHLSIEIYIERNDISRNNGVDQVETILKQLERTVGGWDSSKCPVVR